LTLVDTNVVIDLLARDPEWSSWSEQAFRLAAARGPVHINDVIFAELAARYRSVDELETDLGNLGLQRTAFSASSLFLASKVFVIYRRQGGLKTSTLPVFFIGAQAQTEHWTILTRDIQRYRAYFPDVALIAPDIG
jgi:predicted nucleic acid-binding protein